MQLLDTLRQTLPKSHMERLAMIDAHDFSLVRTKLARDMAEKGQPLSKSKLDATILALKQYYMLPIVDSENAHAISKDVDGAWHSHILFTRDYVAFCEKVTGGIMHHEPLLESAGGEFDHVKNLYNYTLDILHQLCNTDEALWPSLEQASPESVIICVHFGTSVNHGYQVPSPLFRKDARFQNYN